MFFSLSLSLSNRQRSRVWFLGANLQWGIIDYPKMQLRRDVLFSFADVLGEFVPIVVIDNHL